MNEVILHVAAEGGGLTLYGHRTEEGWLYRRHVIDWTPELLDEPWVEHASGLVRNWDDALALLDNYPWYALAPTAVHAEFRRAILKAVLERTDGGRDTTLSRTLPRWNRICSASEL